MNSKKDYYKLFAELFCYVYRIYFNEISYEQPVITKNIQLILHNIKKYITHYTEKEENSEEQVVLLNELNIQYILFFHKLLKQKTIMQNINNVSVFNSCVITFLLIKSFNNQTKTFKSEEKISKFCSYLIYTFRLLSLRYWYYKNEQYNENQQEFNISLAFTKLKTNCLTNTSDNCFEEITQIRAYCKKISMHENSRAKIVEISDDIIKYENTEIVISQLSTFFHTLIKKAKSILYEDLLLMNENEVKSLISINDIEDSLNERTVNFCFVNYITKKQDLTTYKDFMIKRLFNVNDNLSQQFDTIKNNEFVYKQKNINEYLLNRKKFIEYLLLLVHMTSDASVKGTEILTTKYKNTLNNRMRNIFFNEKSKLFMINIDYHKGQSITRNTKNNIRFLSHKVSYLLCTYLIFIQSFYDFIKINIRNEDTLSSYLFENNNKEFTSEHLTNVMKRETILHLSQSFSILCYRHVIKYIIKRKIKSLFNVDSSDSEDTDNFNYIEDLQANHTT